MSPIWLVVVVAVSGAPKQPGYSTPQEIIKRLEASPTEFSINPIEALDIGRGRLAEETWKQAVREVELPRVTMVDGRRRLDAWPAAPAAKQQLADADTAWRAKDYAAAATAWRKALERAPDSYIASAYLGDALLFGDPPDVEGALAAYEHALALNPHDGRLYFFRATALRKTGKFDAAMKDLVEAITLRPRNETVLHALRQAGQHSPLHVESEVLVPRAFVRRDGKKVNIYVDATRLEWLAWANCKALWLDDAAYRKARTGSDKPGFSMEEERECLVNLLSVYVAHRGEKDAVDDDRLNRLEAIAKDHLLDALIIYELASRVSPQVVLTLSDEERSRVRTYVEKYVLTRVAPEGAELHE